MQTKAVDFHGPAGNLEGILMTPAEPVRGAAVLCHAHPLHGGVMRFKLLYRVAKLFREKGFAVLRFNFRGVGKSEGKHADGLGEQDDVRAALARMRLDYPDLPVLLGGFSFGSVMALRVGLEDARVDRLVAMGFPVGVLPRLGFLDRGVKPTLFVQGALDQFGDQSAIERVVSGRKLARLVVVPGSDHFFTDAIDEVERAISEWPELI